MYGRTNGQQDMFSAGTGTQASNRASDPITNGSGKDGRQRGTRPASAVTGGRAGDRDSLRSADGDFVADGTSRSDPGGDSRYNAGAVCIDEKVLKQISDNQTTFMQERITRVEKNFGDLCDGFAKYARGIAKLRDRGDVIARSLLIYSGQEKLNPRMQDVMSQVGEGIAGVQDYRESQVRRIEEKVVKPLTIYGTECKQAKERLKAACIARKKELDQKKQLDKSRDQTPWDRQRITKGQTELQQASVNASKASDEVEQEMEKFEEKKLQDIKQIAKDYITIEMLFHAKALEIYSQCFQQLDGLQEFDDLEFFRNSLRPMSSQTRMNSQRAMQSSAIPSGTTRSAGPRLGATSTTLSSTGASDTSVDSRPPRAAPPKQGTRGDQRNGQQRTQTGNGQQQPARNARQPVANNDDDEDEEDEDDDEDDEDEDDDDDELDDEDDDDEETEDLSSPSVPAVQMRQKPAPTRK